MALAVVGKQSVEGLMNLSTDDATQAAVSVFLEKKACLCNYPPKIWEKYTKPHFCTFPLLWPAGERG
jgi:hypothetical protein